MEPPQELPEKFAPMGLTYDDVLLLPGYSDLAPERHRHHHPADPRDHAPGAAGQRGDGHRHREPGWRSRWPARAASACCTATSRSRTRPTRSTSSSGPRPGSSPTPSPSAPTRRSRSSTAICGEYRVSGLPVVDVDQQLLGIITNRDLRFTPVAEWATTKVDEIMTPMPLITGQRRHLPRRRDRCCCASTSASGCRSSTTRAASAA